MEIECLGGINEIGGNKILVEHKGTRVLLDFGMSFKQYSKYFSEFLTPRKSVAMKDFFETNLLPDVKGLYREDYVKHMGRPIEKKSVDAVFLSHAHSDHAQFIHFLRRDIPVYCSEATYIILRVIEETGSNPFSELVTTCETYAFYRNKKNMVSKVTRKNQEYVKKRNFQIMKPGEKIKIGSLQVEMLPVDHSLPGASGFIVYSDAGNLVYTGDIRFHGYNRDKSLFFVKKAVETRPRWLISEGTRIDETERDDEEKVKEKIKDLISTATGLVFIEHPVRDIDRLLTIYKAAGENNRELVINPRLAYLINSLRGLSPLNLNELKILIPLKGWGLIECEREDYQTIKKEFPANKEYFPWERTLLWGVDGKRRSNTLTYKDLQGQPGRYVVSMSLWEINQLCDIKPKNAIWIKSACEPFSDDMLLDEERKNNWLDHFNIKKYSAHASGHASGTEIKEMIKKIKPEFLIPVHTEHPEFFI